MLDLDRYRLSWLSAPFLVAAAAVAAVTLYVALMRGAPLLRASFVLVCSLVVAFLLGYAVVGATTSTAGCWSPPDRRPR
jgi:hypothetical protein